MRNGILSGCAVLSFCFFAFSGNAAETDDAKAKAAFEAAYEAGAVAITKKDWSTAQKKFDAALKALGELDHPNKAVAKLLLKKATEMAAKDEPLHAANELLGLKQWAEAEAAFRKAAETLGETDAIKQGIAAAQAGAKAEKDGTAAQTDVPAKKEEPRTTDKKSADPLEVPAPKELIREQWQRGASAACYWAGERLYLEETEEQFRKLLKGDFAASVQLETPMDHRAFIRLELRPMRDSGKTSVMAWGSKSGSEPFLAIDKDVKARGDARPKSDQLTLALVRTGAKIEFYCNGKLIGHAWDKENQPYHLWVCGKGILDKAAVVERESDK
jgi:hypothetical protein